MNLKLLIAFFTITFLGCSTGPQEANQIESLKSELETLKKDHLNCQTELTKLKDTPEQRTIRAKTLFSKGDLQGSMIEYQGIIDNFPGTSDSEIATIESAKITMLIEKKRVDEENKKALGYKVLKLNTNIKLNDISVKIEKIWTGKRWSFDDHGSEYSLRDAERENIHVLARISITSKVKDPELPAILVYQLNDGVLKSLGSLSYEFRRWKDYGSYLGNYADYGNDFAHSSTIPFNLGLQVLESDLKAKEIFIVLKKEGCFYRSTRSIGNPEIMYSKGTCNEKSTLSLDDFENEYVLLKKF